MEPARRVGSVLSMYTLRQSARTRTPARFVSGAPPGPEPLANEHVRAGQGRSRGHRQTRQERAPRVCPREDEQPTNDDRLGGIADEDPDGNEGWLQLSPRQ